MPLEPPNLDDRDFNQLVAEARRRIEQVCPDWTDRSPSDPGMVLLELFAYLTETMIYRLNRLPMKAYVEFLRLIGVRLQPPAAAGVDLRFSLSRAASQPVEIPRGTRATLSRPTGGSEPPVFVTARAATIPVGATQVDAPAHHCELVEAELAGTGSGLPGLSVAAQRPPIVAPTGDELDLVVGVEAAPDELEQRAPARRHNGKTYRLWREVESFTDVAPGDLVYVADRMAGTITFAPAVRSMAGDGNLSESPEALAAVPPAGREIRLWYRRGGGPEGNVAANVLTTLKDPIPGVQVTNPSPATGGRAAESLENARMRGPQELHALQRAVTARDFQLVAERSSGAVARARAFTSAALWKHAAPGTVEVLLVPDLAEAERSAGRVTASALQALETEEARSQVQRALDERRPLGTICVVNWTRYKTVRVSARIVVRREEDQAAVRQRVYERLHQTISPLPTPLNPTGWRFGQALHASDIFDIALKEPGVRWVDRVRLLVEEVPDQAVTSIAADPAQPRTWHAGSGATLFRSLNDGDGWEPVGRFPGEQVDLVRVHAGMAGLVAVATRPPDGRSSRLYVSRDCGVTWEQVAETAFRVQDATWMRREGFMVLLLATDRGLYQLDVRPGSSPVQVLVDETDPSRALYAVAATTDALGPVKVGVAAQSNGGVFLSKEAGVSRSFRQIGLRGEDIRVLAVQYDNVRSFLWAGVTTPGGEDPGAGCFSWELTGLEDPPDGWWRHSAGWRGGSCRDIAFQGTRILAASHRAGVQRLEARRRDAEWAAPDVRCGLPLRDPGRFHPVDAVAVDPEGRLVIAGGPEGVFRSDDGGVRYKLTSGKEFSEAVTLPETWLFCSGEHDVLVVSEDEAD